MDPNRIIKMRLVFEGEKKPYLLDVSSLFYDLELLHDFSLLLYAEGYHDYRFSRFFWYRRGRPLKDEHRLRAVKIIKESPLTIELILHIVAVSSGAIWAIAQAIEKVGNWKLSREKLKLEVEKLRYEKNIRPYDEQKARIEMEKKLLERECWWIFNSLIKKLEANSIKLKDIDLSLEKTNDENDR
ncbi:MAG: hypothetical protein IB616_01285 [Methanosarcinales archaeon]|nr:MAG: hypothetical protein IB616_01285 [Methanosarcinales archaeon]